MPTKKPIKKKVVKPNVVQRLQKLFDNATPLEGEQLYYILAAIRGPDDHNLSEQIKDITAARFRSIIGVPCGSIGCDSHFSPIGQTQVNELYTRYEDVANETSSEQHYMYHVKRALEILEKLGVKV
jgi:hypothetical protein